MAAKIASCRDPRIDPQSGDALQNADIEWRVVAYIECLERIEVEEFRGGHFVRNLWPLPDSFRKWAKDAFEVRRSEDTAHHDLLAIESATRRNDPSLTAEDHEATAAPTEALPRF